MASLGSRIASLRTRLTGEERLVFCPTDEWWFNPHYTRGACPLCGARPTRDLPRQPLWMRIDRFYAAMGGLLGASVAMAILVVVTYINA